MALDQAQIKALEEATGHSVFGPSTMPRIIDCPASVQAELTAGLKPESPYAAKGTLLHEYTEKALHNSRPKDWIIAQNLDIDDTALILDSIDYFFKILAKHPGDAVITLESKGNLQSYGLPEVFGTMDCSIMSARRKDVIDWKYGYGVGVYAKDNTQGICYMGMEVPYVDTPDMDTELYIHICQPPKQIYDEWKLDYPTLYKWILGNITDAINESRSANPKFGPSLKACRFCKNNMKCMHRHKWLREQAQLIQRLANDPSVVSNEQWANFLDGFKALKAAATQAEAYAIEQIMGGHDFPGYKLVQKRANRTFIDPEKGDKFIKDRLGKKAFKTQELPVISLAQAEKFDSKLKKDDNWTSLIHKPEGGPKLVKASAKGKAMVFGATSVFDQIAREEVADKLVNHVAGVQGDRLGKDK